MSARPVTLTLYKLFYLSLKNISVKWTRPVKKWRDALNRFQIEFPDRVPPSL